MINLGVLHWFPGIEFCDRKGCISITTHWRIRQQFGWHALVPHTRYELWILADPHCGRGQEDTSFPHMVWLISFLAYAVPAAPATFQHGMHLVLAGLIWESVMIYLEQWGAIQIKFHGAVFNRWVPWDAVEECRPLSHDWMARDVTGSHSSWTIVSEPGYSLLLKRSVALEKWCSVLFVGLLRWAVFLYGGSQVATQGNHLSLSQCTDS